MSTVNALPLALQPWQTWLQLFETDIAVTLGELLLRLDPLMGRGQVQVPAVSVVHDGLGGIDRRGPYERLLLSEWGLADAAPDEFLRRAAAGEHLFLAPRAVERQTDAVVVGLFDAGPLQWGAPRLVQVALWILLARRARTQRARFLWGMAHLPGALSEAQDASALLALLHARTPLMADDSQWQAWTDHLQQTHGKGERWWFGGQPATALACTHQALTRSGIDRQLQVRLGRRGSERALQLSVPTTAAAARLLRGEFRGAPAGQRVAAHGAHRFSRQQRPIFSLDGQRVVVPLLGSPRACQVNVPTGNRVQHRRKLIRYHEWSTGMQLLSGLMVGKEFCGVLASQQFLRFWKLPGLPTQVRERPPGSVMTVRPGLPQWMQGALVHASQRGAPARELLLLDHGGHLLGWTAKDGPRPVADQVVALQQVSAESVLYARFEAGVLQVGALSAGGARNITWQLPLPHRPKAVWLARRGTGDDGVLVAAHFQEGGRWACRMVVFGVGRSPEQSDVSLWQDWRPQGLVAGEGGQQPDRLLVLRADRRALLAAGKDGPEMLYTSASDIGSVSVSVDGTRVAVVDLAGNLRVLGDGGRMELLAVHGSEEAHG